MFVVSGVIDGECKKPLVPPSLSGFPRTKRPRATLPEMKELIFMKFVIFLLGIVSVLSLVGCTSTPVAVAAVGPDSFETGIASSNGVLEVYSRLSRQSDDQNQNEGGNPAWYQHSNYSIYNQNGRLLKRVINTIGHYDSTPCQVLLPPGQYVVKARAKDYFWVSVPVTIESGRTTRVHLDDDWKSPADSQESELVILPNGNPVGWRAGNQKGGSGSS
jgi:hypothetical protein